MLVSFFAQSGLNIPDVGLLLVKCLAVLGGAAVGAVIFPLVLIVAARLVRVRNVPRPVKIIAALVGAIVVGFLVFAWVFGAGGQGGFGGAGGGWWPFGQYGGVGSDVGRDGDKSTKDVRPPDTDKGPKDAKDSSPTEQPPEVPKVHVLGGARVVEQRFFILDAGMPVTFEGLTAALRKRLGSSPRPREVEVILYKDSIDRDNPAIAELEKWITAQGLTPKLSLPDSNAP
jgi:hypothetical protein